MENKTKSILSTNDKKIFVLDTNVVLHDYRAIYSFEEHNVVIPITLLEEVDRFKKGHEIIHYNAREFSRELDSLMGENYYSDGIKMENGGTIFIATNIRKTDELKELFWEDKPDHRILAVAFNMMKEFGSERTVLVTKDINLRMKAKSVGIKAEDYLTGMIQNIDDLYTGRNLVEGVNTDFIDRMYQEHSIPLDQTGLNIDPKPYEYYILRNTHKSLLSCYDYQQKSLRLVEKKKCYGILPRNSEQTFALDALTNPAVTLVSLSGKAGTGKTLMALAAALEIQMNYKQILLARPIIPLSNRDMGFLPGDIQEKLDPYMQPLFDNLSVIRNQFDETSQQYIGINKLMADEKLIITPLAYIRGRSLSQVFFIVDEAQNLTPHEVKTIITRAGEGTKIVFTGDPYQIDTPYLDSRSNGLTYLIDKMKGQDIYAHITLERGERSHLAELASQLL